MPKTKALRDETKYRLLPPLDADTYAGLKANIAINGVQVPIVRDEKGYILDGFARAKIAKELGYECPSVTVKGLSRAREAVAGQGIEPGSPATGSTMRSGRSSPTSCGRIPTDRIGGLPSRWEWITRRSPACGRRLQSTGGISPVGLYARGRRQVPTCDQE